MADTINLQVTLSAYTKGIIPDVSGFITDAPADGNIYGRQNNEWVDINIDYHGFQIQLEQNSGLILNQLDPTTVTLAVNQWFGYINNLPNVLDNETIYYTIENDKPNLFIGGSTAFDEDDLNINLFNGGTSNTINFQVNTIAMNSGGQFNE